MSSLGQGLLLSMLGKVKIHLVPYDEDSKSEVAASGTKPLLDLTLKATKSWDNVVEHLEKKWVGVRQLRPRIRVFHLTSTGQAGVNLCAATQLSKTINESIASHPAFSQHDPATAVPIFNFFYSLRPMAAVAVLSSTASSKAKAKAKAKAKTNPKSATKAKGKELTSALQQVQLSTVSEVVAAGDQELFDDNSFAPIFHLATGEGPLDPPLQSPQLQLQPHVQVQPQRHSARLQPPAPLVPVPLPGSEFSLFIAPSQPQQQQQKQQQQQQHQKQGGPVPRSGTRGTRSDDLAASTSAPLSLFSYIQGGQGREDSDEVAVAATPNVTAKTTSTLALLSDVGPATGPATGRSAGSKRKTSPNSSEAKENKSKDMDSHEMGSAAKKVAIAQPQSQKMAQTLSKNQTQVMPPPLPTPYPAQAPAPIQAQTLAPTPASAPVTVPVFSRQPDLAMVKLPRIGPRRLLRRITPRFLGLTMQDVISSYTSGF